MRRLLGVIVVAACAEPSAPLAPATRDSVFAAAYLDLVREMRPHGCFDCHTPAMVLDARGVLELVVETNQMPPESDDHAAGIADDAGRARLLDRVRVFRRLGDAALAR